MGSRCSMNHPKQHNANKPLQNWILPAIIMLAFVGFVALRPPCNCGVGAETAPQTDSGSKAPEKTVVFYLHGTIRCTECLEIEQIAKETVHASFADQLAAGTLAWQAIDYDLEQNAEYQRTFKPPCPSLILASVSADGQVEHFKTLGKTWKRIKVGPDVLRTYVREELQSFMRGGTAAGRDPAPLE